LNPVDLPLPVQRPNPPSEPLAQGYRVALLLTGDVAASCEILRAVFALAAQEMAQFRSKERRNAWLIRQIRSRALKWRQQNGPKAEAADPLFFPSRVAALPEPARSVFALFHSVEGGVDDLAELLRLRSPAFVSALVVARQTLAPDAAFPKNARLRVHRPWGEDRKAVAKAVRSAQADPELAAQINADQQWHEEIEQMAVPEELALLTVAEPPRPGFFVLIRQPAVLAIALALLVVVGVLVYIARTRMDDFPGKDTVEAFVEDAGSLNGSEFEAISPTAAGKLDDWFVMKGFEGFNVPPQLEEAKAVGCRITQHEGVSLAHVALDKRNAMLLVFRIADLKIEAEGDNWRIFQADDWAVAVRTDKANGYIVMFQGDCADMPGFLQTVGK